MDKLLVVEGAGAAFRKWRIALGLSQVDVAFKLGVAPGVISDMERGNRRPGIDMAFAVEDLTGLDARIWTKPRELASQRGGK
jgi:predicted transcriptional regulator